MNTIYHLPPKDHENDALAWANLSNSDSDTVAIPAEPSEKGKKCGRGPAKKGKEKKEGGDHMHMHIWTERERRKKMRNMFSALHSLLPQLPSKADKSTIVDEAVNYIKTLQGTLQRLQKQKLDKLQLAGNGGITSNLINSLSSSACDHPSVAATSGLAMLSTREAFMADQVASSINYNNKHNNNNNNNNNSGMVLRATNTPCDLPAVIQTWTSSNVVLNICGDDAQFLVYTPKKSGLLISVCAVLDKYKMDLLSAHISSDANRSVYMIQSRVAKGISDEFSKVMTVEERFKQAGGEIMLWVSA